MKAIRVTRTSVLTYIPNLNEEAYKKAECQTIEDALIVDENDLKGGEIDLTMLSKYDCPQISHTLEIVDIDE